MDSTINSIIRYEPEHVLVDLDKALSNMIDFIDDGGIQYEPACVRPNTWKEEPIKFNLDKVAVYFGIPAFMYK